MNGAVAILLVALAASAGGGASILAHRFVAFSHRRDHHEVGAVVFLQLGVVFAVLLAFVFDETWGQYNAAAQAVDLECGALHGASMIATTLKPAEAHALVGAEVDYVVSVVGPEWREMARHRREDLATDDRLVMLVRAAALIARDDPARPRATAEILSLLATAHAEREARIFQVGSGVPGPLWAVLIVFAVVLEMFVALAALSWPATAFAFSAVFAAGITSILVIGRLLDYPFEGALAIPSSDFVDLLGKLRLLLAATGATGAP